jgi:hypothetical protein
MLSREIAELRASYVALIKQISPNMVVTLGARLSISPITFQTDAKEFLNRIQRQQRARNWSKWPKADRPVAIGFIEKTKTNPHMHIALKAPDDLIAPFLAGSSVWRTVRPQGDYHSDHIADPARYASYITKEFYMPVTHEEAFVYA